VHKIGIIICSRYKDCGGGKCFRAMRERAGAFSVYPVSEAVEIVGFAHCGGCPGGNIEHVPAEMKKNGATVIHLATGLIVGYPPCPRIRQFKQFIESAYDIPVVIGTHPIPLKYFDVHAKLPFWTQVSMKRIAGKLMSEDRRIMEDYN
jgi:predicted metal-binding protein